MAEEVYNFYMYNLLKCRKEINGLREKLKKREEEYESMLKIGVLLFSLQALMVTILCFY